MTMGDHHKKDWEKERPSCLERKGGTPRHSEGVPCNWVNVALFWEISDDKITYTIHLYSC